MAKMKLSTKARRSFSRATGIPTTRSGRSRKVSRATGGCATLLLAVLLILVLLALLIGVATAEELDYSALTDAELTEMINSAKNVLYERNLINRDGDLYEYDDGNGISLRLTGITFKNVSDQIEIEYVFVNNSDNTLSMWPKSSTVNGWDIEPIGYSEVKPGHKVKDHIRIKAYGNGIEEDEAIEDIVLAIRIGNDSEESIIDGICLHFDQQ